MVCFQNKNQAERVAEAKKIVKAWIQEGEDAVRGEETDDCMVETRGNTARLDTELVTESMLDAISKVSIFVGTLSFQC